ncbi:hypothetical protein P8C59_000612 [Phyllachora maydis]|uniref:Large ribosomal subunit protein mL44 n=1 Tax=Phyllachora maydis TaxID=1825666 RepID=A0AAD9MAJ0_9PEZI|nr:hypothetical protein P8C59_000612 [Phyllachora maydis]
MSYPSPDPRRAVQSAKLAALHARLTLPQRVPIQTLARALVDASADENPAFNNVNLAFLGQTIINYHVGEWLMCRYPRLPMAIVFAAMKGYGGVAPLHDVARSWGIEAAAVPGGEVDPGLLQFSIHKPGTAVTRFGYRRVEAAYLQKFKWRRGISSRVVMDDDFGDVVSETPNAPKNGRKAKVAANVRDVVLKTEPPPSMTAYGNEETRQLAEAAYANAVRAIVGALYAHCGRETVKAFIRAHILSRSLDLARLFTFEVPTKELRLLCDREGWETPIARLLSETGRQSRTPVFVVGIFSGNDKLGEAAGPNLDFGRKKAAINALKSWYLYSPGENVRVPSDTLQDRAAPWEPVHIDLGEVNTN